MKQYQEAEGGNSWQLGSSSIPSDPNNTDRARMLAEIEAGEAEIIAYVEPVPDYAELRRKAYGALGDQLDMLWHAIDEDLPLKDSDFYSTLKAVKATYPKPE
ncbi:hypothetical protein CMI47_08230 [Candidatus Pacearchaeota archaeon]|nr:hypothetical protein [Candidatus Pacearchaeota archaeon]